MSRTPHPAPYRPGDPIKGLIYCGVLTSGTVVSCEPDPSYVGRWKVTADMSGEGDAPTRTTYRGVRNDGESDYCGKPEGPDKRIPALPDPNRADDGYDWMALLPPAWKPVPAWNDVELGDWPFVVVAVCLVRAPGCYGAVGLWLEGGEVELTTHTTREDFRERLDELSARYGHE